MFTDAGQIRWVNITTEDKMGLYDEITVHVDLPNLPMWAEGVTWQTKSLGSLGRSFIITKNYKLFLKKDKYRFNKESGYELTNGKVWLEFDWGGILFFHYLHNDVLIEYAAVVKHGEVRHISQTYLGGQK